MRLNLVALVVLSLASKEVATLSPQLTPRNFLRLVDAAQRSERPLAMRGRRVLLNEPIVLSSGKPLTILGPGLISGCGHSVFQVSGNRQKLRLENELSLQHLCAEDRALKRETGAAIFARGKSNITLEGCSVSSQAGYGLWVVQRASVELVGCTVEDCGRSGLVLFGSGSTSLCRTTVRRCALHGICARGDSFVGLDRVAVEACGIRGIYAYHNTTLAIFSSVRVSGTQAPFASAVQIEALRPEDRATVILSESNEEVRRSPVLELVDNGGRGLSISGNVAIKGSQAGGLACCSSLSAAEQLDEAGMMACQGEAPMRK
jgi:hypothetical protein